MTTALADQPALKHPAYRVWRDVAPEVRAERLQTAIARVVDDESTADIAKDMGISRSALNMAFLEYAPTEWTHAQVARSVSYLEEAEKTRKQMESGEIECSKNMLTLARDKEKSAQWKLERLCRRLFGQDAPPQSSSGVTINIGIQRDAAQQTGVIIDGEQAKVV